MVNPSLSAQENTLPVIMSDDTLSTRLPISQA